MLITFDDGLKEQIDYAKPILDQMGIPACFFVNPSNIIENSVSTVHQIHLLRSYLKSDELIKLIEGVDMDGWIMELDEEEKAKAELHYNYDMPADAQLKYLLNFKLDSRKQAEIIGSIFNQFFSDSENIPQQLYMSKSDLKQLSLSDELGSHTYHHLPLGHLYETEIISEIQQATISICEIVGKKPFAISYPYGGLDACRNSVASVAESDGYGYGFTMERAGNLQPCKDSLRLARFDSNDVPGGKFNGFETDCFFDEVKDRSWVF